MQRTMKYVDFKFVLGGGSTGITSTMDKDQGEPPAITRRSIR
jgi:hypothetical protein